MDLRVHLLANVDTASERVLREGIEEMEVFEVGDAANAHVHGAEVSSVGCGIAGHHHDAILGGGALCRVERAGKGDSELRKAPVESVREGTYEGG